MEWIVPAILVLGVPIATLIWLIATTVSNRTKIDEISRKLSMLESEIARAKTEEKTASDETPVSTPDLEALTRETILRRQREGAPPKFSQPVPSPQPIPPIAVPPQIPVASPIPEPTSSPTIPMPVASAEPANAPPIFASTSATAPPPIVEKGSFEMRLGTYWLVRVGIVMLLTGLVFFGNYAYHNFIGKLGAGGKISLLYLASALLLGAGAWWQRKASKESLRNYGQVLFAGGLAFVYFTTYAAHHIVRLRIIESAVLDGVLLLAWAGFMAWIADRKKSEVLALFAVGLAYYTSVMTQVGAFTLYSNLILTLAAVFFLVRNRWAWLSFASLVATYASYSFWRFFHGGEWRWATPGEGLWLGAYFLMSYWLVFTAAVFLSKHEKLVGQNRAAFLTFNNGAFFTLFLLTMLQVHSGKFWQFSLIYGAVLLVLVEVSRRIFPNEPLTKNSYLTQGLLLVTVGFISKYSGLQLALVLAAESVVLFVLGTARRSLILQIGAYLAGGMSVGWGFDGLDKFDTHGLWLGCALGSFMVFNSFWAHRQEPQTNPDSIRAVPAYFAALAVLVWGFTTWQNTSQINCPLFFAAEAIVLTASVYLLRIREVALVGQTLLLAAHCLWQFNFPEHGTPPWWNPALLIGMTLGFGHWWQRQKIVVLEKRAPLVFQIVLSLLFVLLVCRWLGRECSDANWLALSCLLAAAVTAYAVVTRAWLLAACAQLFLLPGLWLFVQELGRHGEVRFPALAPIAALGVLSFGTMQWFKQKPDANQRVREPLLVLALAYRWVALAMSLWWVLEYIAHREQIWTLMLIGLVVFVFAGWRKSREALLFGAAFSGLSLVLLCARSHEAGYVYLPNALAILALLGQQQITKRVSTRYTLDSRAHAVVIVLGGLTLWLFVSRLVLRNASGFYLTASWSGLALALFACGMVLRERMYRWLGLAILAGALGRVVVFDVWKLETLYRILSFMALGIVLLVLGFIYNKFQEKIREWL